MQKSMSRCNHSTIRSDESLDHLKGRREVLKAALGIGLGASLLNKAGIAAEEDDPTKISPQIGDLFVFFSGDRKGEVIKPDDLPLGGPQEMAYPMDPNSNVVRDGSLLNMVVLVRFDPAELDAKALQNAAEGVVAYSAVCTHQACPVSMWREDKQTLFCACHGSQYDPRKAAKVVTGPTTKRLAMLPLKFEEGELLVAGKFTGRVGAAMR